ncbi:polycystin 2L1 [Strigomonas culicis]|uniref:Polycystin 2L1 n=1 Tax=Strigomonas culicis TaxID=28005 RepID=S9UNI0_9TRYP|nr:polycystin 2L1 [Strigomonas culicis]|eukprot:EPY16221.1 polycystin 2L1 [Strigomonas culicis]
MQWEFAEEALLRKANAIDLIIGFIGHTILLVFFCVYLFDNTMTLNAPFLTRALLTPFQDASLSFFKNDYHFNNLKSADEYKDFVINAVLPILASPQYLTGSSFPIGAVRFRTQRVKRYSCTLRNNVVPKGIDADRLDCYGMLTAETEDKGVEHIPRQPLWVYRSCSGVGGYRIVGAYRSYDCGGYLFDIPLFTSNLSLAGADHAYVYRSKKYKRRSLDVIVKDTREHLEDTILPFVDDTATRFIVMEISFYNPSVHLFSYVHLYAEMSVARVWRTGMDIKHIHICSSDEFSHTAVKVVVFGIASVGLVLFSFRLLQFLANGGSPFLFFSCFHNLMSVIIYALLICSGILEVVIAVKSTKMEMRVLKLTMSESFPTEHSVMATLQDLLQYINGFIVIFLFCKVPFYIQSERTTRWIGMMSRSHQRIVGIVVLFSFVLTIFAMTCNTFFQSDVWEFITVSKSFRNIFYIMLRQISVYTVLSKVPEEQLTATAFIFWMCAVVAIYIVLGTLPGVMRESLVATVEQEPATSDVHYIFEYLRMTLRHPSRWWHDSVQWLGGYGQASQLRLAVTKLQQYRGLQYPVVRHVYDVKSHVLTLQRLQCALRQPFESKNVFWLYRRKQQMQSGQRGSFYATNNVVFTPEEMTALWEFLQLEWRLARESKRAQRVKEDVLWTSEGVQEILDEHAKLLREFPARLAELELGIRDVTARLSVAEVDTVTADVHSPGIAGE